jgi:electron transfer flavoprotein beta subunit
MKVLVPVKRVIDANVKVRVKGDHSGVELNNVKMAMNPFCEIAVEAAIAMGADRGILVEGEASLEPLAIAKILKAIVEREEPGLVIMGKQAVDGDNNQTGQMLAGLLGWPQATFVSKINLADGAMEAVREVDGGLETVKTTLPAIVTVDLRLNEPRYASLPNIMKAKKKPLDVLSPDDLGVDVSPRLTLLKVTEPPSRKAGVKVGDVGELVDKLRNEAKVI